jgi:hypothetical protein
MVQTDVSEKFNQMVEAVSTPEMEAHVNENTWCNIPEDSHLHIHPCKKFDVKT